MTEDRRERVERELAEGEELFEDQGEDVFADELLDDNQFAAALSRYLAVRKGE